MSENGHKSSGAPIILDDPNQGFSYSHRKAFREHLKLRLNSRQWQFVIIALVICDALLVGTDIILSSVYCANDHPPHTVEVTEEWLRILSIIILSFFVLEWLLEAWVHGFRRWTRTVIHAFDLAIVVISLGLEYLALFTHDAGLQIGGLLVVFRLWRVVRVMHAVKEVQHKRAHEQMSTLKQANEQLHEIQRAHHELVKGLHHEFVQRLQAVRSAKLEHLCEDAAAEKPVLKKESPTLDDLLHSVAGHNASLKESVLMHRRSIHIAQTMTKNRQSQIGKGAYDAEEGDLKSVFTESEGHVPLTATPLHQGGDILADISDQVRPSSDGGSKL